MAEERTEQAVDIVVEVDGRDIPFLLKLDVSSIATLRGSLGHSLGLGMPFDGILMCWDKITRNWKDLLEADQLLTQKDVKAKLRCGRLPSVKNTPKFPKRRLVVLSKDSSEFAACVQLLADEALPVRVNVSFIERVENPMLEAFFESRRTELRDPANKRRLIHYACSNSKISILDICKRGFQEDLWQSGDFGRGVYFLRGIGTSLLELPGDSAGEMRALVCEVAVGSTLDVPATISAAPDNAFRIVSQKEVECAGFDSIRVKDVPAATDADLSTERLMYVIQHMHQAIPRYAVTFTLDPSATVSSPRPQRQQVSRSRLSGIGKGSGSHPPGPPTELFDEKKVFSGTSLANVSASRRSESSMDAEHLESSLHRITSEARHVFNVGSNGPGIPLAFSHPAAGMSTEQAEAAAAASGVEPQVDEGWRMAAAAALRAQQLEAELEVGHLIERTAESEAAAGRAEAAELGAAAARKLERAESLSQEAARAREAARLLEASLQLVRAAAREEEMQAVRRQRAAQDAARVVAAAAVSREALAEAQAGPAAALAAAAAEAEGRAAAAEAGRTVVERQLDAWEEWLVGAVWGSIRGIRERARDAAAEEVAVAAERLRAVKAAGSAMAQAQVVLCES